MPFRLPKGVRLVMAVIRFTSEFSGSRQAVNVWHFSVSTPSTSLANEAISAVDAFFEAIKTFMAPGTWNHGARVTTVDLTPNIVVPATPLTTTTNGVATAALQVAAGVSWQSAFIGKSYRGRTYLGPIADATIENTGATITSAFQTAILTASNTLRTPTTGGAQLVVWSEKLGQGNAVVGSSVPNALRTQRRRLT